jgi:hypothetical protein
MSTIDEMEERLRKRLEGTAPESRSAAADPPNGSPAPSPRVVLSGIRIPFWELVGFLVKVSLAAIPAAIILAIIYAIVVGVFIGGIMGHH